MFQKKGKEDPLFKVCIDLLHEEIILLGFFVGGFFFSFGKMKNTIVNS